MPQQFSGPNIGSSGFLHVAYLINVWDGNDAFQTLAAEICRARNDGGTYPLTHFLRSPPSAGASPLPSPSAPSSPPSSSSPPSAGAGDGHHIVNGGTWQGCRVGWGSRVRWVQSATKEAASTVPRAHAQEMQHMGCPVQPEAVSSD